MKLYFRDGDETFCAVARLTQGLLVGNKYELTGWQDQNRHNCVVINVNDVVCY